jgi:hypothetical protein
MADFEHPRTPSGDLVVDVLIQANTSYPTVFRKVGGELIEPRTPEADLVRGRVARVPFAAYWGEQFQEWRDVYAHRNPAGFLAQEILRAAETQDGRQLWNTVAAELADKHPEDVLSADVDLPEAQELVLAAHGLSSLGAYMTERRNLLGSGVIRGTNNHRDISDSWITYCSNLAYQEELETHDALLADLVGAYNTSDAQTRWLIENEGGYMGGYGDFDRIHGLKVTIARTLAKHLPDVVLTHLKAPQAKTSPAIAVAAG